MIILTEKGKGKVNLTDEQMSVIMSGLAVAFSHWNELADPEVTTSREDLMNTFYYLLTAYAKSVGLSKKDVAKAIDNAVNNYKKDEQ